MIQSAHMAVVARKNTGGGGLDTVTFDATSNSGEKTTAVFDWSHTTAGVNRGLWVGVSIRDVGALTVTGITYNGVAMNFLRGDGDIQRSEIWYLAAPATGANTVQVTLSGTPADAGGGAVSFNGVDQTTPNDVAGGAGNDDTSNAPSQAIVTVTNGAWTFANLAVFTNVTATQGANQTERWDITFNSANGQAAGSTSDAAIAVAGSKTMNWSLSGSETWAISVTAVRPATL